MCAAISTLEHPRVTRELVLVGEDGDAGRRGDKEIFAVSRCQFECKDDATLARCVEAIRASDEHLRNRPEEMMLWDWQSTFVECDGDQKGGLVLLGVAWYDEEFFAAKQDSYLDALHKRLYSSIGLPPEAIRVSHWRYEGGDSSWA